MVDVPKVFDTPAATVTVKIDKFGRILIPSKIRKRLGLKPGTSVDMALPEGEKELTLKKKNDEYPKVIFTEQGLPIIDYGTDEIDRTDIVAEIKAGREERDAKVWKGE